MNNGMCIVFALVAITKAGLRWFGKLVKELTVNKDAEFGSGRQEVEKTREEVCSCSEKGREVNWCEIRGCRGELIGGR